MAWPLAGARLGPPHPRPEGRRSRTMVLLIGTVLFSAVLAFLSLRDRGGAGHGPALVGRRLWSGGGDRGRGRRLLSVLGALALLAASLPRPALAASFTV